MECRVTSIPPVVEPANDFFYLTSPTQTSVLTMSNIFITPASISDAPTFFQLASEAFTDDDLYQHGQSCCKTPEHRKAYQDWRTQLYVETMTGSNKHSYKAVDHNSGKVVGFVILHGPVSAEEKRKGKRYENVPRFMDRDFYEALGEGFKKMRGDVLGDEEAKSWCKFNFLIGL